MDSKDMNNIANQWSDGIGVEHADAPRSPFVPRSGQTNKQTNKFSKKSVN